MFKKISVLVFCTLILSSCQADKKNLKELASEMVQEHVLCTLMLLDTDPPQEDKLSLYLDISSELYSLVDYITCTNYVAYNLGFTDGQITDLFEDMAENLYAETEITDYKIVLTMTPSLKYSQLEFSHK